MALGMDELFYGPTEPTYLVSRARHSPIYSDVGYKAAVTNPQPFHSAGGVVVPPSGLELMVPMCCSKCEEKVREALLELNGVEAVFCDPLTQRVTVSGFVDPMRALKKVRKFKKHAQLLSPAAAQVGDYIPVAPSKYRASYREYTPSYIGRESYLHWPTYGGDGYSNVVTNPYYFKHIQTEY